ncbi:MAG: adenylate kinase [Oscillospiraceae bacterium]|nr:adenylate kinase [Oscillospiraceae bacterium]MDD4367762.1 adenylate kinase [Oscillospiraceae bacterium]
MRLIIMGPPGAGKGTVAPGVCQATGCRHISTGDMFRSNIKNQTVLGQEAQGYIKKGQLVPDELTIRMVRQTLLEDCRGDQFLLDGFPRNVSQAEALDSFFAGEERGLDAVILLVVPDEQIIRRLSGRMVCPECGESYNINSRRPAREGICDVCGNKLIVREDDREETVKSRLEVYHSQSEPLADYYDRKGLLLKIDGSKSPEAVTQSVADALRGI